MTQHLVVVALGPVQEFIAQARRTRDLWFGSALLSELSRAAAGKLQADGAALVFPAALDGTGVANKIVATVEARDEEAVAAIVVGARDAALAAWKQKAIETKRAYAGLIRQGPGADALWEEQVESFLEVNAVWCDVAAVGGYKAALDELDRALAARKGLREFAPWEAQLPKLPKSSLDGARQTVLREGKERDSRSVRDLRIDPQEQLDAVGLIKRAQPQPEGGFLPITNVALGPWIERAAARAPAEMSALRELCQENGLNRLGRERAFAWEAQVFMRDRWAAVARERHPDDDGRRTALLNKLRDRASAVLRRRDVHEPHPYVVCVMADGDDMGRCLRALGDAEAHWRFSEKLSSFAVAARVEIERHAGSLVYAGGDDVLAFVSVPRALACAAALRHAFARVMENALEGRADIPPPTLSVGLGVGHVLESMGHLRELGRRAEHLAKQAGTSPSETRRDALGVIVDKRSGGTEAWRSKWEADPVGRLQRDTELLGGRLPLGKVFEVSALLRRMPRPHDLDRAKEEGRGPGLRRVLDRDARRILARAGRGTDAEVEGDTLTPEAVGLDLSAEDYVRTHAAIGAWVSRMQVAATFADAARAIEAGEAAR